MKRFAKLLICITAIIIISILFCLTSFADEAIPIASSTTAVMNQQNNNSIEVSPTPSENPEIIVTDITEYLSGDAEDIIWDYLSQHIENEKVIAGIMGFFYRESKMRSNAIAGWATRDNRAQHDTSEKFTQEIDAGLHDGSTKEYFIEQVRYHFGGYGLGQWLSHKYLDALYDFAQEWGTSIGDAEMQCAFMAWSIENQTKDVWEDIKDNEHVLSIGRRIGYGYDGTGYAGSETIASAARGYYKKYGTQ